MPPDDLIFEENTCNTGDRGGTLGRKKAEQKTDKQKKERKLYQIKREIEDKVAKIESDIEKGRLITKMFESKCLFILQVILKSKHSG